MFRGRLLSALLAAVWLFAAAVGSAGCAVAAGAAPVDAAMSHMDHADSHCEAQCLSSAPARLQSDDIDEAWDATALAPSLVVVVAWLSAPEPREAPLREFEGRPARALHDIRTVRLLI